jgi:orotidine-5'-phosphate decarboxylase
MKINLNDHPNFSMVSEAATTISEKIIVALDMPTAIAALEFCDRLPDVTFWKVGLELFIADGAVVLRELKARQKKIFLDLKLHDIPNTVGCACRVAAKYGADFLTIHAAGGRAMMQAAQAEIADSSTQLLAVSLLTSISTSELNNDLQVAFDVPEYVWQMISMAQTSGLSGAVCSPHEVKNLRSRLRSELGEEIGNNFCFVTPGVRPVGADVGDQRRVMTPQEAIAAGANYLVIGRPITAVADPVAAWQEIIRP